MPGAIIIQAAAPCVLTPERIAELLDCSLDHVRRLIEARRLVAVNLAPDPKKRALYRVPLAALQRFLQEAVVS